MALFVVRHQHAAERCPAQDPYSGAMLLNHLSRPNVRRHGVQIQGEAVVQGEHTLYMIVEARRRGRRARVHAAVRAGRQRGYLSGVDLCRRRRQRRLRRRPCLSTMRCPRSTRRSVPAGHRRGSRGPSRASAQLRDVDSRAASAAWSCRTRVSTSAITSRFPTLDAATWRLRVGGLVERPLSLEPARPRQMPSRDAGRHAGVRGQRPVRGSIRRSRAKNGTWAR